jgi:hypothetical protein
LGPPLFGLTSVVFAMITVALGQHRLSVFLVQPNCCGMVSIALSYAPTTEV